MAELKYRTGPFVLIGWTACLGICAATGIKLWKTCEKEQNSNPGGHAPKEKRAENVCLQIPEWQWPCPAMEKDILSAASCSLNLDPSTSLLNTNPEVQTG